MQDDLSDVSLRGIMLVTDDHAQWVVPTSMNKYDSVAHWWAALIENRLFDGTVDREMLEKLHGLIQEYDALQSEAYDGLQTVPHQSKIRAVVREVTQMGMTIQQASRLLGVTESRIIQELYCNRTLLPQDISERIIVEHMVREQITLGTILSKVTMTESQIYSFAAMLGLQVCVEPTVNTAKPAEARTTAMRMKESGRSNIEISQHLLSQGYDILPATISQWWNRHNKRGNNNG